MLVRRHPVALRLEAESLCNSRNGCNRRTFITGRCLIKICLAKTLLREKYQVMKYIFDYSDEIIHDLTKIKF